MSAYQQYPQYEQPAAPEKTPNANKKRNIIIGVVIGVVVLCCCLVAILGIAGWQFGWFSRLTGGGAESVAKVMPADLDVYAGFNMLNATPAKLDRVVKPFARAMGDTKVSDANSALVEIDKSLNETAGITLTDDVLPWIGQYAGIGIYGMKVDSSGSTGEPNVILAIEARSKQAAGEFVTKLVNGLKDKSDCTFDESAYEGVTIFVCADQDIAFTLYKNFFLLSSKKENLQDAIDAQKGESLSKSSMYKSILKQLPKGRFVTFYSDNSTVLSALSALTGNSSLPGGGNVADMLKGWQASAFSVTVVEAGLQMDSVTSYNLDEMTAEQKAMLEISGKTNKSLALLPDDTFLFIGGSGMNRTWDAVKVALVGAGVGSDFDEAMAQLEDEIGFNLDTDLFPYLDGDYVIAAMPSNVGVLADTAQLNMGFVGLFGTTQPDPLGKTVDTLVNTLKDNGATIDESTAGGAKLYITSDPELAFGISDEYLGLGSSKRLLSDVYNKTSSLNDSVLFKEATSALPNGMNPSIYLDVQGGLDVLRDLANSGMDLSSVENYLKPIRYAVAAGSPLKGNTVHQIFLIAIEE